MTTLDIGWIALLAGFCVLTVSLRKRRRSAFPSLRYLSYCRFPLLVGAVALLLGPLSLALPALLRNLFILEPAQFAYLAAGSLFLAWTVLMTLETVLEHAGARFEASPPPVERPLAVLRKGWLGWTLLLVSSPLGSALWGTLLDRRKVVRLSTDPSDGSVDGAWQISTGYLLQILLFIAIGAAVAVALYALAGLIQRLVSPGSVPTQELMFGSLGRIESILGRWHEPFLRLLPERLRTVPENGDDSVPGYLRRGRLAHGHVRNLMLWLVTFSVYVWGAIVLRPEDSSQIPAIAFVLVIIVFWGWLLPGVAFFADRYRLPTALLLLLAFGSSTLLFAPDHFFETEEPVAPLPSVSEAFFAPEPEEGSDGPPLIVVAASGGGIKSAVWTARVLSGLTSGDPHFLPSLRLISAVSGGSVGSLYYVDHLFSAPTSNDFSGVVQRAEQGSLFAATWGMAYPDLARVIVPPLASGDLDRGVALERVWDSRLLTRGVTLSQWGRSVRTGDLVPLIMNATVAESGEPLLFSPLDIPRHWREGAASGHARALDCDPKVATAARLSATFPWVTPMSRPREQCNDFRFHLGDGGYYDNFGVTTALHWLEEILSPSGGEGADPRALALLEERGVLLVLIRASADGEEQQEPQSGWVSDLLGPITTLVKVQGTTQLRRNEWEVRQFAELWQTSYGIRIEPFLFGLPASASLSWQLSPGELKEIERAWTDTETDVAIERARLFECLKGIEACRPTQKPFEDRFAPEQD